MINDHDINKINSMPKLALADASYIPKPCLDFGHKVIIISRVQFLSMKEKTLEPI